MKRLQARVKQLAVLCLYLNPNSYAQGILLLLGKVLYAVVATTGLSKALRSRLSSATLTLEFDRAKFAIPMFAGDLGVIFECYLERMYEDSSEFVPENGEICLDIGANIGATTLAWVRTNKNGLIIALEPHPVTFERLKKNMRLNECINVECVPAAMSSKPGEVRIDTGTCVNMAIVQDAASQGGTAVKSITLDELMNDRGLTKVNLCKIDVEGHEVEVLRGGLQNLRNIDRLIIEFHSISLKESVKEILAPLFDVTFESPGRIGLIYAVIREARRQPLHSAFKMER